MLIEIIQLTVLLYFVVLNAAYLLSAFFGLLNARRQSRYFGAGMVEDAKHLELCRPVSIIIPCYNEEPLIVASVYSLLNLDYLEYEVIVVCDGSKDNSLGVLTEAYQLYPVPLVLRRQIHTDKPIDQVYYSRLHSNLVVVYKQNSGRSDTINAGINLVQYPLMCVMDADSVLNPEALLYAGRAFVNDDELIAVGGAIGVLNGVDSVSKERLEPVLPKGWLERVQVLEYIRSFISARAGWEMWNCLMIISGAFGVFKVDKVVEVGGYDIKTIGEDFDLVMSLQRRAFDQGKRGKFMFLPQPLCWTEVPSDWKTLRKQRNRWQRGLLEVLWKFRGMFFRWKYGRVGSFGLPFYFLFEALSPFVEMAGYATLLLGIFFGGVNWLMAGVLLLLAMLFSVITSYIALGIESLYGQRYNNPKDRFRMLLIPVVEMLGIHQILTFERFVGSFQVKSKKGSWGAMKRKGLTIQK
jgi:cellulose synthase/poly-beta-1,6-N-acetylglucosamine synthase-like glycosyltransferase